MAINLPYKLSSCMALLLCLSALLSEAQEVASPQTIPEEETASNPGAAPTTPVETTQSVTPEPTPETHAAIPSDAQLETSGAKIGRIDIKVVDIFDPENPKESGKIYRAANKLHINTRESTIRPQLLFKSGAAYSRHVLDETARNLRARRYLEDTSIVPVAYHPDTNTVDVLVRVQDVWTLNPGATLGRSGGETRSGVQIEEGNLLGLGKSVSVDRINDVDRNTWRFAYADPNLFSTRWEMRANYSNSSDGAATGLNIQHPFYALDTRLNAALDGLREERTDKRYERAVAVDQYQTRVRAANVQGGWSTGLRSPEHSPAWVMRLSFGYKIDETRFVPDQELGTQRLPSDIVLRYPWFGVAWFQDKYEVTRNRDRIDRTEDLYVGRSLTLRAGYASKSFGSDRNAMPLEFLLQDAKKFSETQVLYAKFGIAGRLENNSWRGALFSGQLRYDLRESNYALLMLSLSHAHLDNPDDAQQLFLGSDEGMRGYPLRYRSITERNVFIAEQRFYTNKQILRLLSIGGAAFVDVARISGEENPLPNAKRVFTDVGFGLRLGNIRSSRGDIFHLDLAYPLNAEGDDRKIQFSVTTKATF